MRPRRRRRVRGMPDATHFKPQGIPLKDLQEVVLHVEEYEALKHADAEGKPQSEAAAEMDVSQPTYNRILKQAREKTAKAITEGKSLRIEGGHYFS
ncbi:DUF134 domain-containing protein [Candidatus Woesearchaeota archaeon]|nr:DUF134 domain-containing protein [Candidatus Woesearchaeota archaeon]